MLSNDYVRTVNTWSNSSLLYIPNKVTLKYTLTNLYFNFDKTVWYFKVVETLCVEDSGSVYNLYVAIKSWIDTWYVANWKLVILNIV